MSQVHESGPELLSTGETARLLGSSRQHVVDMCTRGELPFVWVGRHRRIRQSAVEKVLDGRNEELTRDQERSLWLHRALLGRLVVEPEAVLERAKQNVSQILLAQSRTTMTTHWLQEWRGILDGGVDDVAEVLTSRSPKAVELRQNSPFAGALSESIRAQVLAAFVKHWREGHSGRTSRSKDVVNSTEPTKLVVA